MLYEVLVMYYMFGTNMGMEGEKRGEKGRWYLILRPFHMSILVLMHN